MTGNKMKTSKPTILVTAAAGSTGMHVSLQLLDEGFAVNAFVRRNDARSAKLQAKGATIVVGSMADLEDMRGAREPTSARRSPTPTFEWRRSSRRLPVRPG
jgi:nucleoside-diphosphate-sugar epimerase